MWKPGIMRDLDNFGLKGRLPTFIPNFLSNCLFKVTYGKTLSEIQEQEMSFPQGSVLSATLFNIKMNNIVKTLNPGIDPFLYVYGFLICYWSKHVHTIRRQPQQCLHKISKWATRNGFKFSQTKTKCVHFCQQQKLHLDPSLKLDNTEIPIAEEHKFLGIIFDKKLTYIPHIKYLKVKCNKTIQLMRVIANINWGADRQVLIKLYRALIKQN